MEKVINGIWRDIDEISPRFIEIDQQEVDMKARNLVLSDFSKLKFLQERCTVALQKLQDKMDVGDVSMDLLLRILEVGLLILN